MREIKKILKKTIIGSLNADQVNQLAGQIDGRFDVYQLSGFGNNIPVPRLVAAETVLYYFRQEKELVQFIAILLQSENNFVFDSNIKIKNRQKLLNILEKKNWLYDERAKTFKRDQAVTFTSDWGFMRDGEEYRLAFTSIDIVSNSKIVKTNVRVDVENTYSSFRSFIQKQIESRNGRIWFWHGDGGVAAFYEHKGIQQSIIAMIAILSYLPVFNVFENELKPEDDIKIRIGVHYGHAIYHQDKSKIISTDLIVAENIEKNISFKNSISITDTIYNSLDSVIRNYFEFQTNEEHIKIYKYISPG
jgi:hypothetical protein